jgi:uncharacterized protein (TIGR02679 family)
MTDTARAAARARARERLASPGFAPIVDELARRLSEGAPVQVLSISNPPMDTRRAIADLFGAPRYPEIRRPQVRIDRLLAALGLESIDDLRLAVEALRGPLPDRRAAREEERAAKVSLWEWLLEEALELDLFPSEAHAALWVTTQRQAGARGGTSRHRARLEQAVAVLRELPAEGVSLAVLADKHTGDPHALDRGRSLAAIVLDAIVCAGGLGKPRDAEDVRATWESAGVVPDQLSSTVLALGLPGGDSTPVGRWLTAAAAAGEPVVLTLSTLRRWPRPALPSDSSAFVFENPSVIAEAAREHWSGPPLICSSGRPTVAVVTLLRQLGAGGATLYQHADLDPAGLAITDWLRERAGTTPWQMDGTGSDRIYEEGRLDDLLTAMRTR